jgi:methionyl-tRNA synthetase
VHPIRMSETYGVDGFRFFLMRDMVVGLDSDFSEPALIARINSDLANDLGNCLNRVERMIHAHFADRIPDPGALDAADEGLAQQARLVIDKVLAAMDEIRIHQAIEETMELVRAVNRYLEVKAPWKAVKNGGPEAIAATLATAAEAIRLAVSLLVPVMPGKCGEALYRLGMIDAPEALVAGPADPAWLRWGGLRPGAVIRPGGPLFPRIETATDAPA